jgi:cytosine/creatinine deaminase
VIVGGHRTFMGGRTCSAGEAWRVVVLDDAECIELMEDLIAREPALGTEDTGEE